MNSLFKLIPLMSLSIVILLDTHATSGTGVRHNSTVRSANSHVAIWAPQQRGFSEERANEADNAYSGPALRNPQSIGYPHWIRQVHLCVFVPTHHSLSGPATPHRILFVTTRCVVSPFLKNCKSEHNIFRVLRIAQFLNDSG